MEIKKYVLHIPVEDLDLIKKEDKSEKEEAIAKQIDNYMLDISSKVDELEKFADFTLGLQHTISENGFKVNKDYNVEIDGDSLIK